MKIGELFVALGFNVDDKGLKQVDRGMKSAKINALAFTAAITATTIALQKMISASLSSAVVLKNFGIQTGLSIDELQRWRFVAEQNDISGEELIGTLKGIQQAQAAIRMGSGNIKPFQLLGISPTEDPFTILQQLKEKIKDLDPAIATSILTQMGVGENFLNILKQGTLEFNKLNKEFLITKKEQKTLIDLNKSFKELVFGLRGTRDRLIAMISPELLKFFKSIKNNLLVFIEAGKGLFELINRFKFLGKVLMVVGGIALAYFSPIISIILGLILVVDDLYIAFKGGNSIIGEFVASLFGLKKLPEVFDLINNNFKNLVESFKNGLDSFKNAFKTAFEFIKNLYEEYIAPIFDKFSGFFDNKIVNSIFGSEKTPEKVLEKGNSNSQSNTNNINITVNGTNTDGKKIAFDIKEVLSKELNKAYYGNSQETA